MASQFISESLYKLAIDLYAKLLPHLYRIMHVYVILSAYNQALCQSHCSHPMHSPANVWRVR